MKKSVIIAALGLAAGALSSFGQGSMAFNSYLAGASSTGVKVYNTDGVTGLSTGWTADLAWSTSPISDASGNGSLNPLLTIAAVAAPSQTVVSTSFVNTPNGPGYFEGGSNFVLQPYTAGTTVYFEILAYETGDTYANSPIRGHSASFSTTLSTGTGLPPNMPLFGSFAVAPVPEPTTLALAGLGGLASLIALRRKQA